MHEIEVRVVSLEEADHGTPSVWLGGRLFGFTRLDDGELVSTILPSDGRRTVSVNARSLHGELADAQRLLESFEERRHVATSQSGITCHHQRGNC